VNDENQIKKNEINYAAFEEDFQLIKNLTEISSCSGFEGPISDYIKSVLKNVVDKMERDSLGNLICTINGKVDYKILLDAHFDEIGLQISHIEENGFLRIVPVGGHDLRMLAGSRVSVHGFSGETLKGVVGNKAIHLQSADERKKVPIISKLFVDVGLPNKNEVKKYVNVGDFITMDQTTIRLNNSTRVTGKALDNRASCHIVIRVLQWIKKNGPINPTVVAVFASQEEIGVRGAVAGAYHVDPDMALVFDVNHAMDFPGAEKSEKGDTKLSGGPIIPIGPNIYPKISRKLVQLAEENEIPYQTQALPGVARNDARGIQLVRSGIPVGLITPPLRYMHSQVEIVDLVDLVHCRSLAIKYLLSNG
jgi:putative aminopeptidase FrvX